MSKKRVHFQPIVIRSGSIAFWRRASYPETPCNGARRSERYATDTLTSTEPSMVTCLLCRTWLAHRSQDYIQQAQENHARLRASNKRFWKKIHRERGD